MLLTEEVSSLELDQVLRRPLLWLVAWLSKAVAAIHDEDLISRLEVRFMLSAMYRAHWLEARSSRSTVAAMKTGLKSSPGTLRLLTMNTNKNFDYIH